MTELNSPETHIYISTRLSRVFKQRLQNIIISTHAQDQDGQKFYLRKKCEKKSNFRVLMWVCIALNCF